MLEKNHKVEKETASSCVKIDKDDADAWTGLAIMSLYFGSFFEQKMNCTLNPVMKKIANDFYMFFQDQ